MFYTDPGPAENPFILIWSGHPPANLILQGPRINKSVGLALPPALIGHGCFPGPFTKPHFIIPSISGTHSLSPIHEAWSSYLDPVNSATEPQSNDDQCAV